MLTFALDGAMEGKSKNAAIHAHALAKKSNIDHELMALSKLSNKLDNKR
jgi:mannitol/fructose-specific phosphotransferase system IIA component (Ntr-type)